MTYANAVAAVAAARSVIKADAAKWKAQPTPPEKIKKDVQDALQPALDYLEPHNIRPNPEEMSAAEAEELIDWIDKSLEKLEYFDDLTVQLNAKPA